MKAMVLNRIGRPLSLIERDMPQVRDGQVLVEVRACAVCRTDLHVIDGELPNPKLPLIPGHEIVGRVLSVGPGVVSVKVGNRVGIPWLGQVCGICRYCLSGRENLCDKAIFTGYTMDGGYATHMLANANFCFDIPSTYGDAHAAPLLCAGLIGHRALKAAGSAERLGIYGFGAAAHIVAQIATRQGRLVYAFTRPNDKRAKDFALSVGCHWAGDSNEQPPEPLDAAIIFAPVGELIPLALRATSKGGTVVLGGIHMSPMPAMAYEILWGERVLRSVANLTRQDGLEFMQLAANQKVETTIEVMALEEANTALQRLRDGELSGAAVLLPNA